MPDPLQSDVNYDEKADINNYLEAAFDRDILAGLPTKYIHKYRDQGSYIQRVFPCFQATTW